MRARLQHPFRALVRGLSPDREGRRCGEQGVKPHGWGASILAPAADLSDDRPRRGVCGGVRLPAEPGAVVHRVVRLTAVRH